MWTLFYPLFNFVSGKIKSVSWGQWWTLKKRPPSQKPRKTQNPIQETVSWMKTNRYCFIVRPGKQVRSDGEIHNEEFSTLFNEFFWRFYFSYCLYKFVSEIITRVDEFHINYPWPKLSLDKMGLILNENMITLKPLMVRLNLARVGLDLIKIYSNGKLIFEFDLNGFSMDFWTCARNAPQKVEPILNMRYSSQNHLTVTWPKNWVKSIPNQ